MAPSNGFSKRLHSPLAVTYTVGMLLIYCGVPRSLTDFVDTVVELTPDYLSKRDLVHLDLFSGVGNLNKVFNDGHMKSDYYDVSSRGDKNNILLKSGLGKAIQCCLRLEQGGLLHIGLPCSSFIWLNRATSKRSISCPWGDEDKSYVSESNTIAVRVLFLILLCTFRGVYTCLEQPMTSLFKYMPTYLMVKKIIHTFIIPFHQTFYWMGCFGHFTVKGSHGMGTASWLPLLYKPMPKNLKKKLRRSGKGMVKKKVLPDGKVSVSGGPKLRKSQAYPMGYAKKVLKLHLKLMSKESGHLRFRVGQGLDEMQTPKGKQLVATMRPDWSRGKFDSLGADVK